MTYNSIKAVYEATGVPVALLRLAKERGGPGFNNNGSVNYDKLEPWVDEHRDELEEGLQDSLQYFKKENEKRKVVLNDLEIQKRKGEYLEPQAVKDFLNKVGIAQHALFIARFKELPPKLAGKSPQDIETALKEVISEICNIFSQELDKWKL